MVFLKNYCRHKVKKGQNFKTLRQNNAVLRRAALSGPKPAPGQSSSPPNLGLHWVCPVLSFPSWTSSTNHCCYVYCSRKCSNPPTFNAESQYFISLFNKISWLCGQQPGGDGASNARCKTGTTAHDYTDYFSIFIVFSPHCPTLYVHMGCYCIGNCIIAFPYLPFAQSIYIWKGMYRSISTLIKKWCPRPWCGNSWLVKPPECSISSTNCAKILGQNQFDWPIAPNKMKLWRLLKIEGSVLIYIVPPLEPTYIGESAKAYGLKVRFLYGEHVGEHIVNLGNILGTH